MLSFLTATGILIAQAVTASPTVGVIADDLVDYSQWAAQHKALWTGAEASRVLAANGVKPTLLTKEDLTLERLSRFDAILIATDHTYPERGPWGGPVAKALVEYVRQGGIYAMPIGIPHWTSKDIDSGKLDSGHWEDFFGLRGSIPGAGRAPLQLTKQGREIGLPDPKGVNARPARLMNFTQAAVLVWSADYVPCLSAVPFEKGWLIHWGAGPEGGMDVSVRDFLLAAEAKAIVATKAGRLRATDRQGLMKEEGLQGKSLDDLDREAFKPGPAPFEGEATPVTLEAETAPAETASDTKRDLVVLDGKWQMLGLPKGTGDARKLAHGEGWEDAIDVQVPCSVQAALFAAGKIPDPTVGFNDVEARKDVAEKEWWFRRDFGWLQESIAPARRVQLAFDGVDYSATFWLNGIRLGEHEGPFGGPTFDVTSVLGDPHRQNTLVVRVDPLPPDWKLVFKTNCVYGWHYVNCPPIGIWRPVRVERGGYPAAEITELFVRTADVRKGTIDVHIAVDGYTRIDTRIEGRIRPASFEGKAYRFATDVTRFTGRSVQNLRLTIPEPRLWWPVDLGEQPLYRLDVNLAVTDAGLDKSAWSRRTARFGIRTIEMAPLPGGPAPDQYNWTFVVNGRPTFLKGCNWATIDAFLRLTPDRYRRFLRMAKDEHIQIMRSWGGGLLETDEFYDICDELGIMVMQEFPLTWQDFDKIRLAVADEIVVRNVERLRNHPSLAMWCGGNEHHGTGWLIELLGRRCLELDGTRPYHRTDPYGGSIHDYGVYWGKQPFEHYLTLVPPPGKPGPAVIGETGLASACAVESTLKFLPEAERSVWPPPDNGTFIHHTPTFTKENMDFLNRHAKELDECKDLAGFTRGTQLAQALGLRAVNERMRCRWPDSTAMIFYKLTDVFPGCSWSTVDYYGVPKIAHYFVQDSFAPLHVCALHESFDATPGKELAVRIMLLDDTEALPKAAVVSVRLFDARLQQVGSKSIDVNGPAARVRDLGEVELPVPAADVSPLLMVVDLRAASSKDTADTAVAHGRDLLDRSWYWFNFRARPGCLFNLPKTALKADLRNDGSAAALTVTNTGKLPAVAVHVDAPECSDSLRLDDAYFWLDPGEERHITVRFTPNIEGQVRHAGALKVAAWNSEPVSAGE